MYQSIKRDTRFSRGVGHVCVVIGCTNNSKKLLSGSYKAAFNMESLKCFLKRFSDGSFRRIRDDQSVVDIEYQEKEF